MKKNYSSLSCSSHIPRGKYKRGATKYETLQFTSDPEYMRTTLWVTILILGLVIPQPMETLVLPFRSALHNLDRTFLDRRSPSVPSLHVQDFPRVLKKQNTERKYKEDLQKLLLILNKPKFIHNLL